jgi:hypothetical protein
MNLDEKIDSNLVSSAEKFVDSISKVHEESHEEGLGYLREPLTIFDQSAEDFFTEVTMDFIEGFKYPYAVMSYLFNLLIEKQGGIDTRDIKKRAEDFEKQMGKLILETPNISGITIAIFITIGMLAIYLFTATIG